MDVRRRQIEDLELIIRSYQIEEPIEPFLPEQITDEAVTPISHKDAELYLSSFFATKNMYYGGPISEQKMLTEYHIRIVRMLNLYDSIDLFLTYLAKNGWNRRKSSELFLRLQNDAFHSGIRKEHSGGLMLIYLSLCLGYEI